MYNHLGFVAEASGDNVFLVKGGVVYTPPVQAGSLDGITRRVVIRLAKQEGIGVVEKNLTRFDLYSADELFLTGTAAEVIGVIEMDGRVIDKADGRDPNSGTRFSRRPIPESNLREDDESPLFRYITPLSLSPPTEQVRGVSAR